MRTFLSLGCTALLTITLVACKTTNTPDDGTAMEASSTAMMEENSSDAPTHPGIQVDGSAWTVLQAWAPGVQWSAVTAGTNDETITIDDAHSISAGAIQAEVSTATVSWAEFDTVFMDTASRQTLAAALGDDGWMIDLHFDADGPTGTSFGFRQTGPEGTRFLRVSAHGTDCSGSVDTPPSCSTYEAKVFLTHPLPADADL